MSNKPSTTDKKSSTDKKKVSNQDMTKKSVARKKVHNNHSEIELEAKVSTTRTLSLVWLIPLVSLFVGLWMVLDTWANQGPVVTIFFETAEGLEVGTTKIKYREITIGQITNIELNSKFNGVKVTAQLNKNTETLLRTDTDFWVVKPRIGNGGISGLSTLFSGSYIEVSPGLSKQKRTDFVGLEIPPVTDPGAPGLRVTLDSDNQTALKVGDPILFYGIQVGKIEYVHFNVEERKVYYDAFIQSPYDKLVTTNTRFWKIDGIEFNMDANGLRIQTGTLETFVRGGVTFDVPENLPKGQVITERAFFTIYENKSELLQQQYRHAQKFILLFGNSIRGLSTGAPVEFKGVRIGSVVRTDIFYPEMGNLLDEKTRIPVLIQIEPARLGLQDSEQQISKVKQEITSMIGKGLHAFISSASLLTGSKYIEIQFVKNTHSKPKQFNQYLVIPTAASEIDILLEKVDHILGTFDKLSLGQLVDNASDAMKETHNAMINFSKASHQVDSLLDNSESADLIKHINQTLFSIENLAKDFSAGSKTQQEIIITFQALEKLLKQITPILSQLQNRPNSLIFAGEADDEVEPKGKSHE